MGFADIIKKVRGTADQQNSGWRAAVHNFGTAMGQADPNSGVAEHLAAGAVGLGAGMLGDKLKKKKKMPLQNETDGILQGIGSMFA